MDTLTGRFGPREIAWGVALGLFLGLMPKTNLLAVLIALLLFLSHANIVVGVLVAVVGSFAAAWVHPFADELGGFILNSKIGQQLGGAAFRLPIVPWTFLDNTLVLGCFLLGLVLLFPAFLVVWTPLKIVMPKTNNAADERDELRSTAKNPTPVSR